MTVNLPVTLTGMVCAGKKLGRTIDVPTANIIPLEDVADLEFGVYYSETEVDGKRYKSISNLGCKPTVNEDGLINIETFLFDFDGDIYGDEIKVDLIEFRRPEMKFDSFDELSKVIKKDLEAGRLYTKDK